MGDIRRMVLRRAVNAGITIFGIMTLNFFLINAMGDPVKLLTPHDPKTPPELVLQNCLRFGLCDPVTGKPLDVFSRFVIYLENMFKGDWGTSYYWQQPVFNLVMGDLSWTLVLVGTSTVITILIGILLGAVSAQKRGQAFDIAATSFSLFFYGMPIFWLGLMLQLGFTQRQFGLHWWPVFPTGKEYNHDLGYPFSWQWDQILSALQHLVLPATTLALGTVAGISLVMRNSLVDAMTEDYVTTARAKGLAERLILRRHVLPNGLPPMVTLIALDMAFVFGGAYQVEYVFSYQGIGWRTIAAIDNLDFPVLQFIVVIGGIAVVLANFIADLILVRIDPRIKIT